MGKHTKLLLVTLIFSSLTASLALAVQTNLRIQANFPEQGTEVIPLFPTGGTSKDTIQMGTFGFVTVVPTITAVNIDKDVDSGSGVEGRCGFVVEWAQKISDKLKIGGGGSLSGSGYDNLTQIITSACGRTTPKSQWLGQYWCTWIVIDSYKLAGIPIAKNPGVVAMHKWWKKANGFKYVDYTGSKQNLKQVKPGYAIFLESVPGTHNGREHVALVKQINLDARGNGRIVTLESNASKKSKTYPVSNWNVKNTTYPTRGFGGK